MPGKVRKLIQKYYEIIAYVFFGGCTTLVNLCSYYVLRSFTHLNYNLINFISVVLAIIFAYFVNSRFVFRTNPSSFRMYVQEFAKFVSARMMTMVIEVGGVWFLVDVLGIGDKVSKLMIQFIVLVLNYFLSKCLVFIKKG